MIKLQTMYKKVKSLFQYVKISKMPEGKRNYTTPHVCIPINNPRINIPSERDQNTRFRLQQSALDSFHAEVYGPIFLSVGPKAKLNMYNNLIWINHLTFI